MRAECLVCESTSVNADRLARARRSDLGRDSDLIDVALAALIDREEQRRELAALEHSPYQADDDLRLDDPRADCDHEPRMTMESPPT